MTKNYLNLEGIRQRGELERKLKDKTTISIETLEGEKWESEIEERIAIPQNDVDNKLFVLERVQHPTGKTEFRFGYWIIGKKGKMKGKWTWGQFAPFIPPEDLIRLIEKAQKIFDIKID